MIGNRTYLQHCMDCGRPVDEPHHPDCATHERSLEPSLWPGERDAPADPAAHYRHTVRAPISSDDIARGYTEVRLDPYRVCDIYATGGGPREQMVKKLLRWTDKGQSEDKVIGEIESALKRWKQMREEDRACRAT